MIDSLNSDSVKIRKIINRDFLFWIYPLIILGLIIFLVSRDKHHSTSASFNNTVNADSSITMVTQPQMVDGLDMH